MSVWPSCCGLCTDPSGTYPFCFQLADEISKSRPAVPVLIEPSDMRRELLKAFVHQPSQLRLIHCGGTCPAASPRPRGRGHSRSSQLP